MRRRRRDEGDEKKAEEREAVVPLDPFNERVVIAAAMVARAAADELLPSIAPDHFHARGHSRTWEVLREMHRRGLYYDPQTVQQMSGGEVDVEYLEALAKERPERPPNLRHHVDALRWDKARFDSARGPLAALLAAYKDVTSPPDKLRSLASLLVAGLAGHGSDAYIRGAGEIARAHRAVLFDRITGTACYSYGVPSLDVYEDGPETGRPRMIPGSAPGEITCLTGVSGSGKTTMAAQMILGMAAQGRQILFGAWETREAPSLELLATMSLEMSRTDVKTGNYNEDDARALVEEMERLGQWIKFFKLPFGSARGRERGNANDRQLDIIRQVVSDSGCQVFVADLMRRAMKETKPDDEDQFLYRLQSDGAELGVHQVWLHQIRLKDVEGRRDKRPTREGLKGSSGWVEVPDTVIGFHREALWKDVEDNRLEAIVLKQRYGRWPIAVEFDYDPEFGVVTGGRCKDYARPGEDSDLDTFLGTRGGRGRRH
jgi:replicative DNA helicase